MKNKNFKLFVYALFFLQISVFDIYSMHRNIRQVRQAPVGPVKSNIEKTKHIVACTCESAITGLICGACTPYFSAKINNIEYDTESLKQCTAICVAACCTCGCCYTCSKQTINEFGSDAPMQDPDLFVSANPRDTVSCVSLIEYFTNKLLASCCPPIAKCCEFCSCCRD